MEEALKKQILKHLYSLKNIGKIILSKPLDDLYFENLKRFEDINLYVKAKKHDVLLLKEKLLKMRKHFNVFKWEDYGFNMTFWIRWGTKTITFNFDFSRTFDDNTLVNISPNVYLLKPLFANLEKLDYLGFLLSQEASYFDHQDESEIINNTILYFNEFFTSNEHEEDKYWLKQFVNNLLLSNIITLSSDVRDYTNLMYTNFEKLVHQLHLYGLSDRVKEELLLLKNYIQNDDLKLLLDKGKWIIQCFHLFNNFTNLNKDDYSWTNFSISAKKIDDIKFIVAKILVAWGKKRNFPFPPIKAVIDRPWNPLIMTLNIKMEFTIYLSQDPQSGWWILTTEQLIHELLNFR